MGQTKSRFRQFTDEQWERIEPLLPSNEGRQGHPFRDNRKIVEGIVYRYRAGIPWRDLPREEFGAWQTVWKRHARYARDGTWDRILQAILAEADAAGKVDWNVSVDATICRAHQHGTNTTRPEQDTGAGSNHKNRPFRDCEPAGHGIGRSRGGLTTKIHSAVDGRGRPLANVITGGQRNDGAMLAEVLADIHVPRHGRGRPRTRPDAVIADKAYSSGTIRRQLRSRGIAVVIPEKSDTIAARERRGRRGGRPPKLDADLYRGRNVVERSFALAKQWRALATRYDKLAITYRAAVTLCAILTWLRQLGDTP
ncbi:IS5 family transposase [Dietzia kunjamensis]|uniref:IS5 family transposase n=2 Tax=Mycobacteriales TaxID=85007 RepID=UPI002096BD65|nr:IS5 family transposase [Dietzia kunjamensis]USX47898.1 IS5 family transposase [Dietzia kunjamensis]USX47998.1 IS5 family transposase [Dietzia kunjamensis]